MTTRNLTLVVSTLLLTATTLFGYDRTYANKIPPVQIVGIALSENVDNARTVLSDRAISQGLKLEFPILVDAGGTIAEPNGSTDQLQALYAWDLRDPGEAVVTNHSARLYRLEKDGPATAIILDRQSRIRAVVHSEKLMETLNNNQYTELLENLCLNIDGVEALPYPAAKQTTEKLKMYINPKSSESLHIWEYAAEIQNREMRQYGDIFAPDFDKSQLSMVYPLFGQKAPNLQLPRLNRDGSANLSDLIHQRVSVLVFFWAGTAGSFSESMTDKSLDILASIDNLYQDWTLGKVAPGPTTEPNAQPFLNTAGSVEEPEEPVEEVVQTSSTFGRESNETDNEPEEFTLMGNIQISLLLGGRQFYDTTLSQFDYEIPRTYPAYGIKAGVQFRMLNFEASAVPNIKIDKWDYNGDGAIRQIFFPVTAAAKVQPLLNDNKFMPFAGFGLGPTLVQTKRLKPEPDDNLFSDLTAYYFASGIRLHGVLMLGAQFVFADRILVGIDLRNYFLKFDTVEDDSQFMSGTPEDGIEPYESTKILAHQRVYRPLRYSNGTALLSVGIKL